MKRIFYVEDDLSLINGLSFAIKKQGYEIDIARTSSEAENLWMNGKYDLVILDVSLPDGSGCDLCKKIRQNSKVPIIFLTAADEETDIIMGLDIGGDDYITKPFKLAVFLSRVNALLRRSENFNQTDTELSSNGIRIQLLEHEVYKDDVLIDLTASEYKLLCLFMENPNIVLSSEQILSRLWDCEEDYIDNSTLIPAIHRRSSLFGVLVTNGIRRNEVCYANTGKPKNQTAFHLYPVDCRWFLVILRCCGQSAMEVCSTVCIGVCNLHGSFDLYLFVFLF